MYLWDVQGDGHRGHASPAAHVVVPEEEMVAYVPDADLDALAAEAVVHARFAGIV